MAHLNNDDNSNNNNNNSHTDANQFNDNRLNINNNQNKNYSNNATFGVEFMKISWSSTMAHSTKVIITLFFICSISVLPLCYFTFNIYHNPNKHLLVTLQDNHINGTDEIHLISNSPNMTNNTNPNTVATSPRIILYENVFANIKINGSMPVLTNSMIEWYKAMPGSGWLVPLYDKHSQTIFCHIPKNVGTLYKTLYYVLNHNMKSWTLNFMDIHSRKKTHLLTKYHSVYVYYHYLLNDPVWKSWVVLRDPLERFLSGYLFRCIYSKGFCLGLSQNDSRSQNFTLFSRYFIEKILQLETENDPSKWQKFDHHYLPQHKFCLLQYFIDYYDYIIYMKQSQLGDASLFVMKLLNISKYYNRYGDTGNQPLFAKHTSITQNAGHIDKIKKYFNRDTINQLYYKYFWKDYKYLKLPLPDWFHQI